MKPELIFGRETAEQHFGRGSLGLQSILTHANDITGDCGPIPVKTCHHFFMPHGSKANHDCTITVINQYIEMIKTESAYDFNALRKLVLVCDGSEQQNWSLNVMGHIVRRLRAAQEDGFFSSLKSVLLVKKAPGHGKVYNNLRGIWY